MYGKKSLTQTVGCLTFLETKRGVGDEMASEEYTLCELENFVKMRYFYGSYFADLGGIYRS
jgi:hypothetical protein